MGRGGEDYEEKLQQYQQYYEEKAALFTVHINRVVQISYSGSRSYSYDRSDVMQPERLRNDRNASKVQNYKNYELNEMGK